MRIAMKPGLAACAALFRAGAYPIRDITFGINLTLGIRCAVMVIVAPMLIYVEKLAAEARH